MPYFDRFTFLLSHAAEQAGYFTAKQALDAGYGYDDQHYHVQQGHWERVKRGLYRMQGFPPNDTSDLVELTLLSADRNGEPQLVFSHLTALRLYELTDANPAELWGTVPHDFRKHLPTEVRLIRASLSDEEWEQRQGYRLTTTLRTLLDLAEKEEFWPWLEPALHQAVERGLVRPSELLQAKSTVRARRHLLRALRTLRPLPSLAY
jgi:predicted transcriptional regulator of viral defense system